MVASAVKKTSARSSKSTENAPHRPYRPTHPPWTDMITECITTTPDGTRNGVSRPAIKKFVDSKYHLSMNAVATGELNRAIAHGTDSGSFVLPKGPSGKVKLAPKRAGKIAKENKQSPSKRASATKAKVTAKRPSVSTTKINIPSFMEERPLETIPATRRYTSMAKKARVTPTSGRQVPPRKAATKRGGAKRAVTGPGATKAKTKSTKMRAAKPKKHTNE